MSVAVVRGGDTVALRGYGYADVENRVPATAETAYYVGSISKQFVAAAIVRLVERGRVRLDDPITRYVSGIPSGGQGVTIHHLLTHTSGLPTAQSDPWERGIRRRVTTEETIARYRGAPMESAPGERWAYNNFGYVLLGAVLERVTGTHYAEHLRVSLFRPLGMTSTVYCEQPPAVPRLARGYELSTSGELVVRDESMNMSAVGPGGAFCSTLRDLLRWQDALTSGRVVSRASYAKMTAPVVLNDGTREPYGYALGLRDVDGVRGISHGGGIAGYWSYLSHYPERDLDIVVLVNSRAEPSRPLAEELARRIFAAATDPTQRDPGA